MAAPKKYPDELRERATRMAVEARRAAAERVRRRPDCECPDPQGVSIVVESFACLHLYAVEVVSRAAIRGCRRSLARHRCRVGPIAPIGKASVELTSAYEAGWSRKSIASRIRW